MTITTVTYSPELTEMIQGVPFDGRPTVVLDGGDPRVTCSATAGALPAGTTLLTDPIREDENGNVVPYPEGELVPAGSIRGTPTTAGSGSVTLSYLQKYGTAQEFVFTWTVSAGMPTTPVAGVTATATGHNTVSVSWDPVAGATGYTVTHAEQGGSSTTETSATEPAVTLTGLEPETVYELTVTATDGNTVTDPSPVVTVTTDPTPGAMPPTLAALVDALAPVLAGYLGRPGDPTTEALARAQLPVIVEFVRGYTRGTGWTEYTPPYPLRSVIVSAGARLVGNPEQVSQYAAADYSERPAVLQGYTLAELAVLRRYRRVQA